MNLKLALCPSHPLPSYAKCNKTQALSPAALILLLGSQRRPSAALLLLSLGQQSAKATASSSYTRAHPRSGSNSLDEGPGAHAEDALGGAAAAAFLRPLWPSSQHKQQLGYHQAPRGLTHGDLPRSQRLRLRLTNGGRF